MKVKTTSIPGVMLVEPRVFTDARGYFAETWSAARYREYGIPATFVQDNLSHSQQGVLRGLHFQNPNCQDKLVYTLAGSIFDVCVDVRLGSPTFGCWYGATLSQENRLQLYIPPGFAHGFCVTSATALIAYKCGDYYSPSSEHTLIWNDPDIKIDWPGRNFLLSDKDQAGKTLAELRALHALPTYKETRV